MAGSRTDPIEDARLVAEVVTGSEDAFAALYDRHAGAVYAAAAGLTSDRQLAEDVVQETFLALWNRAEQFDPTLGSLAAWLLTIARNRTVDRLRAAGRRPAIVPIAAARIGDETDAATLERVARAGEVVGGAAMGRGPGGRAGRRRAAPRSSATRWPGWPSRSARSSSWPTVTSSPRREIAERLGWPLGTVKTRTRRALLKLRGLLGPDLAPVAEPDADVAGPMPP